MEKEDKRRYSLFSKTLKSCVEPVIRPILKSQGTAASKLAVEWEHIVGKEMAVYSLPVKLAFAKDKNTDGTLTVACDGALALTFQHMQPVIIERIASYFGYRAVSRIQIEQRRIKPPEKPKMTKKKSPRNIDTSSLSAIMDPELKEALSGLAKTMAGPTMPTDKNKTE